MLRRAHRCARGPSGARPRPHACAPPCSRRPCREESVRETLGCFLDSLTLFGARGGGESRKPPPAATGGGTEGRSGRAGDSCAVTSHATQLRAAENEPLPLRPARAAGSAVYTWREERLGNTSLVTQLPWHRLVMLHLLTDLPCPTRFTAPRSRAISCSSCDRNLLMNTLKNGKPTVSF